MKVNRGLKKLAKKVLFEINYRIFFLRKLYLSEIEKRSKLSLYNTYRLSRHISLLSAYSQELNPPNDFYGHATTLKNFLGIDENYSFKFVIEHGAVLSDHVGSLEIDNDFSSIVTMCPYRKKILERYKKTSFAIGPYIHYANHYLSASQLNVEKKRVGKTLLIFPSHSTLDLRSKYDILSFCQKIKKLEKEFQTTLVCLYWKDILEGQDNIYMANGFKCVTAGHILDPLFLPRLKSIITLADLTISNDAGTHVGYCVYMNKPHIIFSQKHTFTGLNSEVKIAEQIHKDTPYLEIMTAFSRSENKITTYQYNIANKYWGLEDIKSTQELKSIIELTEKTFYNKSGI